MWWWERQSLPPPINLLVGLGRPVGTSHTAENDPSEIFFSPLRTKVMRDGGHLDSRWTCWEHEPQAIDRWIRERIGLWRAVPFPGRGSTRERWRVLSALGSGDVSAARLVEGHLDALAIATELGTPDVIGEHRMSGVWAAQPDSVLAELDASGWRLRGRKDWCSGAGVVDHVLVTARAEDGARLFALTAGDGDVVPDSWEPRGMLASASATVVFNGSESVQSLAGPNAYVDRPGFGHGGVGVAAVWFGATTKALLGCRPVADAVSERARWGRARAAVEAAGARLAQAADEIDTYPCDRAQAVSRAHSVRLVVSEVARAVVRLATEISGTSGLCRDAAYHQSLIDLDVYLTQIRPDSVGLEHADAIGEPRCW